MSLPAFTLATGSRTVPGAQGLKAETRHLACLFCELLWVVGDRFQPGTRLGPEPALAQYLLCLWAGSVLWRTKLPSQGCEL